MPRPFDPQALADFADPQEDGDRTADAARRCRAALLLDMLLDSPDLPKTPKRVVGMLRAAGWDVDRCARRLRRSAGYVRQNLWRFTCKAREAAAAGRLCAEELLFEALILNNGGELPPE